MRKQVDKVNQSSASVSAPGRKSASADQVFDVIHDIMHLYRGQQYRALREGGHELTHMDTKVLGFFARHPGATQSDLAAHSGRDKAQLARLTRTLRDRGLLEAHADEQDRRSTRLQPTPEGQALFGQVQKQGRRLAAAAAAALSDEERGQLVALLRRLQATLQDAPGTDH